MIELKQIKKTYITGETSLDALKDVDIQFRKKELVSILGQSGCGKTTMLNIIGGLDRYTTGDLIIDGISTKDFKDNDWDTYRNKKVGFVFQSYNLISHLSILNNVELALTLSGISKKERTEKAKIALEEVGLSAHLKKKPNQLSGGQMQRVAIARALVNNPSIILADEPTGALDSETSIQIMKILKKISKTRLIVMVTHNGELAEKYSTRIIEMKDGVIKKDSNPLNAKEILSLQKEYTKAEQDKKIKKSKSKIGNKNSAMSYFTALALSWKNLFSKKVKTFMTAFAGSIGIIGIALVLAISNGFSGYITQMQTDILGGYPVEIVATSMNMSGMLSGMQNATIMETPNDFNDDDFITIKKENETINGISLSNPFAYNDFSDKFVSYINDYKTQENSKNYNELRFSYKSTLHAVNNFNGTKNMITNGIFEGLENNDYVQNQYDILYGTYPTNYNEVALVVPENNYINESTLKSLGIIVDADKTKTLSFKDIAQNSKIKAISNDNYYTYISSTDEFVKNTDSVAMFANSNIDLKITAVIRVKEQNAINIFETGIMYLPSLTDYMRDIDKTSEIVTKQKASLSKLYIPYVLPVTGKSEEEIKSDILLTGSPIKNIQIETIEEFIINLKMFYGKELTNNKVMNLVLTNMNANDLPTNLTLYPVDFNGKENVLNHIDEWNESNKENTISYSDTTALFTGSMTQMVDIISYVLIAFASVSLFVSSIMIGVLTYASVLERKKEIGVLRSIGARKKDISRVFNSETFIIGTSAGVLGVLVTYLCCPIINALIISVSGGAFTTAIAILNPLHALVLILISCVLTLIAGLFPAKSAANNDPVKALRSE